MQQRSAQVQFELCFAGYAWRHCQRRLHSLLVSQLYGTSHGKKRSDTNSKLPATNSKSLRWRQPYVYKPLLPCQFRQRSAHDRKGTSTLLSLQQRWQPQGRVRCSLQNPQPGAASAVLTVSSSSTTVHKSGSLHIADSVHSIYRPMGPSHDP